MERVEDINPRILEEEAEAYPHATTKCGFEATFNVQHSNDLEVGSTYGFTKPKDKFKLEYQSEEEHPLSDAEGEWVEEGPARGREARYKSTKRTRNTSRKARSKRARRNINPISQIEEIMTYLPRIETNQGDVYVQIALGSGTYNHSCRTGAATAPQVGNATVYNSSAPQCCPCAHHDSDADGSSYYSNMMPGSCNDK